MKSRSPQLLAIIGFTLFWWLSRDAGAPPPSALFMIDDSVVISAPVQALLTGGDRFLAADLESIRSAVQISATQSSESLYRIRAHKVISQLNPCHEDNYYLGNALLTWGGAVADGNNLLLAATECRYWDHVPPFFYAMNAYFFLKDIPKAQHYLEIAAQRSSKDSASLRKTAIMIAADEIKDTQLARAYLMQEYNRATDNNLRIMLQKRIARLDGLIFLRDAQARFEAKYHHFLTNPSDLIVKGIIEAFPADPLGLGYQFENNRFDLRQTH